MSEFLNLSLKAFSAAARDLPKGADQGPTAVKKRGDKQTVRDKEHRAGGGGAPEFQKICH